MRGLARAVKIAGAAAGRDGVARPVAGGSLRAFAVSAD